MGDRQAKDGLFDAFGEVAKALANRRRAEMVDVLVQGERHVEELASEIGQSVANTSFHLIDELAANIKALPADVEVVAYCRGHYCVYADDAVRLLRRRGRAARRLEDGFPEWQRAELPVEMEIAS